MDAWTNGRTDQQMNGPMDELINGQCFSLLQLRWVHLKMMIFQQILQCLQKHYGPTDRLTDGPMDQQTDISSYRDAIATSKNA